jgi:hypothetical protein
MGAAEKKTIDMNVVHIIAGIALGVVLIMLFAIMWMWSAIDTKDINQQQ